MRAAIPRRITVWLRSRKPTDEAYVEVSRKWLKREKAMRVIAAASFAVCLILLILAGRKLLITVGWSMVDIVYSNREGPAFARGLFVGTVFGWMLSYVFRAFVWTVTGFPDLRARQLMLKFHDQLKAQGTLTDEK